MVQHQAFFLSLTVEKNQAFIYAHGYGLVVLAFFFIANDDNVWVFLVPDHFFAQVFRYQAQGNHGSLLVGIGSNIGLYKISLDPNPHRTHCLGLDGKTNQEAC